MTSNWLIEAHLPLTDLRRTTDPLLRRLLDGGERRPHEIPNADGSVYQTGGMDITPVTQQLIRADGSLHPGRFSYGPPVESVQWVTAIGARPHVNSRTLLQADLIAREALGNGFTTSQMRYDVPEVSRGWCRPGPADCDKWRSVPTSMYSAHYVQ